MKFPRVLVPNVVKSESCKVDVQGSFCLLSMRLRDAKVAPKSYCWPCLHKAGRAYLP